MRPHLVPDPPADAPVPPRELAAGVLANIREMTPERLRAVLDRWPDPPTALDALQAGRAEEALQALRLPTALAESLARRWMRLDVAAIAALLARRGTHVWIDGDERYPFTDPLPDRPPVLLGEGSRIDVFDAPRVAIVGTRNATPAGLADAALLARALAQAGVTVVSGLAIGIDGAAHDGALDTGTTVAVVATGLDVVYPRRHRALDARIRANGLVISESPFGTAPHPGRFPIRNRIIAGLADAVVVVEATLTGGARITANLGNDCGRPVFALPGARRNPAALGTNALLRDGAEYLGAPSDVLLALGIDAPADIDAQWFGEPVVDTADRALLDQLRRIGPASLDDLAASGERTLAELAAGLRRLRDAGAANALRGRWWAT